MTSRSAVFTIVAKNYLSSARVLMNSIRRTNPGVLRIVVLADRVDGCFEPAREPFDVVLSSELRLPASDWFHFRYSILELCTAVKPYAIEFLLRRYGLDRIVYLDPDIAVYAPLDRIWTSLSRNQLILTPHLTQPLEDNLRPSELEILRSGTYNLGFLGLAAGEEALRFLKWWQAKLQRHCVVDLHHGLFVDQRWVDLVPGLFSGVALTREPGYNVAYWNLHERRVEKRPEGLRVNGEPLYFAHFSGFDPERPEQLSRHQNRFRLDQTGGFETLALEYRDELLAQGYRESKSWPWAYGLFENGHPIPEIGRSAHCEMRHLEERIANPFSDEGFTRIARHWNEPADAGSGRPGITRLAYEIYRRRSDIQALMPDVFGADQARFLRWLISQGRDEFHLEDLWLAPASDGLCVAENGSTSPPADGIRLTRIARTIYNSRPELQRHFPNLNGPGGLGFLVWLLTYGRQEHCLDERSLAPLRAEWNRALAQLPNPALRWWRRGLLLGMSASVRIRAAAKVGMAKPASLRRALARRRRILPQPAASASSLQVNVIGYAESGTGVAECARASAAAASAGGLPARLFDVTKAEWTAVGAARRSFNLFHVNADQTRALFQSANGSRPPRRGNIGYWAWELEDFPRKWRDAFREYREIWTLSAFSQEAIASQSPIPVLRMPPAVNPVVPAVNGRERFSLPADKLLFLHIFDMISVFERKNPVAVAKAFRLAFGGRSDCHLVFKIGNSHHHGNKLEELRHAASGLPVTFLDADVSRQDVNALIHACDCLVSLHRAEGFGLTLAEAMHMGKPVIATAYSGNMDFTREDTALLAPFSLCEVPAGCEPYEPGACWAEPDIDMAARHMMSVAESGDLRCRLGARASEYVKRNLSPEAAGDRMRRRLESICANDDLVS